jgi:intracellular sulfur oxidation DsrE/DsrF family protein
MAGPRRRAAQLTIPEQQLLQEDMMTRFGHVMRLTAVCALSVCAVALFLAAPPAALQGTQLAAMPPAPPTQGVDKKTHHLILQVNSSESAMMNLALNNATNVEQYYKNLGEKVEIEVVTFGPGLHMLRDDTSPVKDRIKAIADKSRSISFKACGNTQDNMHKAENKDIPLVEQATLVKSGVVRVMELQEEGWTYVRP